MGPRPFRFAVNLLPTDDRAGWWAKCRHAEDLGYDVITVSDYLDRPSPFVALAAAAEATTRPRLGTYALNAGFYRPALLARDVTTAQQLTGGRFELGIGAGFVESEFAAAGIPWGTARQRIDHLEQTAIGVRKATGDTRILVGGNGQRVLAVAAAHADIVSMTGARSRTARTRPLLADYATLRARIGEVREMISHRTSDVELNLLIHMIRPTREADAGMAFLSAYATEVGPTDLSMLPTVLGGSPQTMAEKLWASRETLGFSYFTVLEPMMADFASVMPLLR